MAELSDVFFVDGVRTPFGRAGEKGMYWNTRSDDLAVKATIGLMERNPAVPKGRIDDVAIAIDRFAVLIQMQLSTRRRIVAARRRSFHDESVDATVRLSRERRRER